MIQRGRKGAARTETTGELVVVERPHAPLDLTEPETEEWRAIIDAMPADWFPRETWPLLAQHCRHIVCARRVSQLIDVQMAEKDIDWRVLDRLLGAQHRETMGMRAMSAALRLSQQSSYDAQTSNTAKNKRTVKRLWDE